MLEVAAPGHPAVPGLQVHADHWPAPETSRGECCTTSSACFHVSYNCSFQSVIRSRLSPSPWVFSGAVRPKMRPAAVIWQDAAQRVCQWSGGGRRKPQQQSCPRRHHRRSAGKTRLVPCPSSYWLYVSVTIELFSLCYPKWDVHHLNDGDI